MTRRRGAQRNCEPHVNPSPPSILSADSGSGAHITLGGQDRHEPAASARCAHQYVEDGALSLCCALCGSRTNVFRLAYRLIEDLQRVRLTYGNRIRQVLPLIRAHVQPPRGVPSWEAFFKTSADVLEAEEHRVLKLAERLLRDDPVGRWTLSQQGIGPSLAVSILGECWPLSRFKNPQKLWSYAGLHLKDGKAVKRAKGQRANWNARLKTRCWLFSQSILKSRGPWRDLYDERKRHEYEKVGAQCPSGAHYAIAPDSLDPTTGAQNCSDAQVVSAPCHLESVGAQESRQAHQPSAPDRLDSGAGAHGLQEAQTQCPPGHDPLGGAQEMRDLQPGRPPADSELGEAHSSSESHSAGTPSKLHLHNRALRFVMKRLLRDLWVVAHGSDGEISPGSAVAPRAG